MLQSKCTTSSNPIYSRFLSYVNNLCNGLKSHQRWHQKRNKIIILTWPVKYRYHRSYSLYFHISMLRIWIIPYLISHSKVKKTCCFDNRNLRLHFVSLYFFDIHKIYSKSVKLLVFLLSLKTFIRKNEWYILSFRNYCFVY